MTAPPRTYRLHWTPSQLAALIVLCLAAAAGLAVRYAHRSVPIGELVPVDAKRAEAAEERINPNTASAGSLQRLPGIGPARARAIVSYRESPGVVPFRSAADLARVPGLGPATVGRLKLLLQFPPTPATATAPAAGNQSKPSDTQQNTRGKPRR